MIFNASNALKLFIILIHIHMVLEWISYFQGTRPRSSTKETRANISLRTPLGRREEKMQGVDFFSIFGNLTFSSDPCVGSGSGKIREGFAARERFDNFNWKILSCDEIQSLKIIGKTITSSQVRKYKSSLHFLLYTLYFILSLVQTLVLISDFITCLEWFQNFPRRKKYLYFNKGWRPDFMCIDFHNCD